MLPSCHHRNRHIPGNLDLLNIPVKVIQQHSISLTLSQYSLIDQFYYHCRRASLLSNSFSSTALDRLTLKGRSKNLSSFNQSRPLIVKKFLINYKLQN
jgi:hypothetical protein